MDSILGYVQGISAQWKSTPADGFPATEMISGEGVLNEKGLGDFMKLHECGVSYAIVAIMGPQSSGKSTLLNHLFHTNFKEMDASIGRGKTTDGIWIAKAPNMDPCIMVMDVEGTDGVERGQDGTTFEKRSTLFALVVADILFINMWCHDVGLENAANRPLLKTIFQVMMQIFTIRRRRKATLHFVLRDKTKTAIEALQTQLRRDVQKIWEIVPKTEEFKDTPLSEIFNVEVDALSNYESATSKFRAEVTRMRKRILNSISVYRGGVIPTSGLPSHMQKLWETIKQNKQLDLPTHNEMAATVRCEEIAKEKLMLFASDKEWLKLEAEAKEGLVPNFGAKMGLIWSKYLSEYDSESKYYQEGVRNAKRRYLESIAFEVVYLAYNSTLDHLRAKVLMKFESELEQVLSGSGGGGYAESVAACRQSCEDEFDRRCLDAAANEMEGQGPWDASFVRKQLVRDIKNHALQVRTEKLPQIVEKCQARLANKITKHLNNLFKLRDEEGFTWARIRSFLKRESDSAASDLCSDIASFGLDQAALEQKVHDLKQYARKMVVDKFKEETESVLLHMNDRYILSLARSEEEPFPKCLKVLATMAAMRLDESPRDEEVESLLFAALMDGDEAVSGNDPLASDKWDEVPPEMTLITPAGCKDIWKQFQLDIQTRAEHIRIADQHANSETSENSETPTNVETPELSGNSETPSSESEPPQPELPYWMKLGLWLEGLADFVQFLRKHPELESAIKYFCELAVNGVKTYKDCPETVKETVKDGFKRTKRRYGQIIKKLEEALKKFYNFMMGIITTKSEVLVSY